MAAGTKQGRVGAICGFRVNSVLQRYTGSDEFAPGPSVGRLSRAANRLRTNDRSVDSRSRYQDRRFRRAASSSQQLESSRLRVTRFAGGRRDCRAGGILCLSQALESVPASRAMHRVRQIPENDRWNVSHVPTAAHLTV